MELGVGYYAHEARTSKLSGLWERKPQSALCDDRGQGMIERVSNHNGKPWFLGMASCWWRETAISKC